MTTLNDIINFFKSNNINLIHYEEDEECNECWEFDGGHDGVLVSFTAGTNKLGLSAIFGEITKPDGSSFCISGSILDWEENFSKYVIEHL